VTVFFRLLEASVDEKAQTLLRSMSAFRQPMEMNSTTFNLDPAAFSAVPGAPFAYWVSESARATFGRVQVLESRERTAKQGLATADDTRFVRVCWEPNPTRVGERWCGFAKGGVYSRFYADLSLLLEWSSRGAVLKAKVTAEHGNPGKRIYNEHYYFRPGLTWPRRTNGLSFRAMPAGCIFADNGPAAFVDENAPHHLLALCALMNSQAFGYLVGVQLARTELAQSYEVGLIQQTPVPDVSDADTAVLAQLARRAWSLKRSLDTTTETSHAFVLPPGVCERVTGLDRLAVDRELAAIQREIDDRAFILYGIGDEDRATIEAASKRGATPAPDASESDAASDDDEAEDDAPASPAADTLTSWLVGIAFGRFDPRLATGERAIPAEPEPFDPLPARSPGMWPEGEEPAGLPDLLVDDEGHKRDLCAHVTRAAATTKCEVPDDLRRWLARELFPLHIKMYSKSRRKAPIYWQIATPSASYAVWLYIHRFDKDTLFRVQNDYVTPKLHMEERKLEDLRRELGESPRPAERKQLDAQQTFVEELRAFHEEVKRVAPLWNPDLDDGVVINFAPLWRLVPQHKPWQKEIKATWDKLCAGDYDWAHLAMHLWPERVVPKCATDRSLAIAHGLQDAFWLEGDDGKWKARAKPTRPIEELIAERTSTAFKAALKSLLDAPSATGAPKKTKKGKAHA